jgi:hypothetical protein
VHVRPGRHAVAYGNDPVGDASCGERAGGSHERRYSAFWPTLIVEEAHQVTLLVGRKGQYWDHAVAETTT